MVTTYLRHDFELVIPASADPNDGRRIHFTVEEFAQRFGVSTHRWWDDGPAGGKVWFTEFVHPSDPARAEWVKTAVEHMADRPCGGMFCSPRWLQKTLEYAQGLD